MRNPPGPTQPAETGLHAEAFEVQAVDGAGPVTAPVGA